MSRSSDGIWVRIDRHAGDSVNVTQGTQVESQPANGLLHLHRIQFVPGDFRQDATLAELLDALYRKGGKA